MSDSHIPAACPACLLRFTKPPCRDREVYAPLVQVTRDSPCSLCLGLLHDKAPSKIASKLGLEVGGTNRVPGTTTFVVGISFLNAWVSVLRNRSGALWLEQKRNEAVVVDQDGTATKGDDDGKGENRAEDEGESKEAENEKVAMTEEERFRLKKLKETPEVKDIFKMMIIDEIEKITDLKYDYKSLFTVNLTFDTDQWNIDSRDLKDIGNLGFRLRFSRSRAGESVPESMGSKDLKMVVDRCTFDNLTEGAFCPPPKVLHPWKLIEVKGSHGSVYVGGRYLKVYRGVSNSAWVVGGQRLAETSVEELIAELVVPLFKGEGHRFASAGREDADVLCLGEGRPFYLEITQPKRVDVSDEEIQEIQTKVNEKAVGKARFERLQVVSREESNVVRESAATKEKSYRCLVRLAAPTTKEKLDEINRLTDFELEQQTPSRVSARRVDLTRDKMIHTITVKFVDPEEVKRHLFESGAYAYAEERNRASAPAENRVEEPDPDAVDFRKRKADDGDEARTIPSKRGRHGRGGGNSRGRGKQKGNPENEDAPAVIRRTVSLDISSCDPHRLIEVEMRTSAGTYIKEFVHGDNGRTKPSLVGLLGIEGVEGAEVTRHVSKERNTEVVDYADVLCLDVTAVHLDWPPNIAQ
ncbi:hypothetical protein BJ742DRAFT_298112 [Cladochytrium replicatum]|nr:hypothetical protein BJ742DRAFT_298112 [Cladochytrium replicatum]